MRTKEYSRANKLFLATVYLLGVLGTVASGGGGGGGEEPAPPAEPSGCWT